MKRKIIGGLLALGVSATMGIVGATSASADTSPGACATHHQLGKTKVVYYAGKPAISVKQYFGYCDGKPRNWAYVWVWDSFKKDYTVKASAHVYDYTTGSYVGGFNNRTRGAFGQQEVKSKPFATTSHCTSAAGWIDVYKKGNPNSHLGYRFGYTAKAC